MVLFLYMKRFTILIMGCQIVKIFNNITNILVKNSVSFVYQLVVRGFIL